MVSYEVSYSEGKLEIFFKDFFLCGLSLKSLLILFFVFLQYCSYFI